MIVGVMNCRNTADNSLSVEIAASNIKIISAILVFVWNHKLFCVIADFGRLRQIRYILDRFLNRDEPIVRAGGDKIEQE